MNDVLINSFVGKFNELYDGTTPLKALSDENKEWGRKYFGRLLLNFAKVQGCVNEFDHIFQRFESTPNFIFRIPPSVEDVVLTIKLYYVNWSTLLDLSAIFIDTVFDIGNAPKDITFGSIIRNRKVKNSNLPIIIEKHKKTIDISTATNIRNEIVHRGNLLDEETEEFVTRKASIEARLFSLLKPSSEKITEEEYKKKMNEFHKEFNPFIENKKKSLHDHLDRTLLVTSDIFKELANIAYVTLKDLRI